MQEHCNGEELLLFLRHIRPGNEFYPVFDLLSKVCGGYCANPIKPTIYESKFKYSCKACFLLRLVLFKACSITNDYNMVTVDIRKSWLDWLLSNQVPINKIFYDWCLNFQFRILKTPTLKSLTGKLLSIAIQKIKSKTNQKSYIFKST